MRSLIVGTAGHIDHGKSALVRALTGTDPDRLKEEKRRGITIDLGFAHMSLRDDLVASFIDVPGHERFVRNMLAGAHGIDAVVLVVAADESVMPQTREHFHICRLLGIEKGVVALTKCDAADGESQAIAELETKELIADSFLEAAPILRVSARTGAGLEELKTALAALADKPSSRGAGGLLRLPIDRSFTVRGFGTVVTGTLVSGSVGLGEELEILPSGRRARVRGLEVHGVQVESVQAPNRTAVNLANVEVGDLGRGDVLARPGTLIPTSMIDAKMSLLPADKPLKDQARVRVHLGSAEVMARVRVLEAGSVAAGGLGLVQLRLEHPAVAGRGDRLIVRSYSPALTLGGAVVLDPLAPKHRGRAAQEQVAALQEAEVGRAARLFLEGAGVAGIDAPTLAARVTVSLEELRHSLADEPRVVAIGDGFYVSLAALQALEASTLRLLGDFHRQNPLKPGFAREELRRRLFLRAPEGAFERVLASLAKAGEVRLTPETASLTDHAVQLTPDEDAGRRALLEAALTAGLQGIGVERVASALGKDPRVLERVSKVLVTEGLLSRVGNELVHREHLESLKRDVRQRWPPGSRLDVPAFKGLTGLSRKYVIPLLEYLDRERVTRRSGDDRLVLT
jgi:selenocysteine-specific elongation factor